MKTRNPVARHQSKAGKGGAHTDRKRALKTPRKAKHRAALPLALVIAALTLAGCEEPLPAHYTDCGVCVNYWRSEGGAAVDDMCGLLCEWEQERDDLRRLRREIREPNVR